MVEGMEVYAAEKQEGYDKFKEIRKAEERAMEEHIRKVED